MFPRKHGIIRYTVGDEVEIVTIFINKKMLSRLKLNSLTMQIMPLS